MTSTPPGWYDDGSGAMRWWDGAQWTEHAAVPDEDVVEPDSGGAETADLPAELRDPAVALAAGLPSPAGTPGYETPPASVPDGYPGGTSAVGAAPETGGAFISATEPRKSKLWIVWVVIGAVLIAIVVGLAVLLPMALMRSAGGSPTPTPTVFSKAEQQAAIDAVLLYDQAYQTADCDDFFTSTTETFRELVETTDCDTFATSVAGFQEAYTDYEVTVTSVSQDEASLLVFTTETYQSELDADGNPTGQVQSYQDDYKYVVVPTEDGWALWDAFPN